ncbi:MAG: GNAT family N-acetyltransferase, partial [Phycisphaerae bacterium]|nr:GNAT family N-acetyltransferase [Phycisphaerae bacterium]
KARAAARQARERDGMAVTHDQDLLKTVYRLYTRSMRRLGSVNYPYAFFETLVQRLRNRAWVTVVWNGKQPVAGLLSFVWRDTVMPYFIGVDERASRSGATNLVYLATMERAVKQQLARFDFGRTRKDNAGSFAFKRNQGFEPRTLGYQRFTPLGQSDPDLTPANPRFALARRIWRHLPLPITRAAGAWLSRALPG